MTSGNERVVAHDDTIGMCCLRKQQSVVGAVGFCRQAVGIDGGQQVHGRVGVLA